MAAIISGRRVDDPWADLSWPAIPGHFDKPWFPPLAGAHYRTLDVFR